MPKKDAAADRERLHRELAERELAITTADGNVHVVGLMTRTRAVGFADWLIGDPRVRAIALRRGGDAPVRSWPDDDPSTPSTRGEETCSTSS